MHMLKEEWICRECGEDAPCILTIVHTDQKLPAHLKGKSKFRKRVCVCEESHMQNWQRITPD